MKTRGTNAAAALATAAALCSLAAVPAFAQHHGEMFGAAPASVSPCSDQTQAVAVPGLRKVDFPVTTDKPEAQGFFDQGMTLLYAFNHQDAMRAFRSAAAADSKLAMAYWGIALAAGPNINVGMDPTCQKVAHDAVEHAWTLAGPVKLKERELIKALRTRYTGAATFETDYRVAMAAVNKTIPNDPDVMSLYAESIMDLRPWGLYDRAGRPAIDTQLAETLLTEARKKRSDHIGANHYLIHAVESSLHPEEALTSAELLRTRVPDAGHLLHMPAHIFMRLGRYHDAVESNRAAEAADVGMYGKDCPGPKCLQFYYGHYLSHNLSFLAAAASMEGDEKTAVDAASRTSQHAAQYVQGESGLEHYLAVYWITLVNFHRWGQILTEAPRAMNSHCPEGCPGGEGCHLLNAMLHWAQGMALAATGKPEGAEAELQKFQEDRYKIFHLSWGNNTPDSVLKIAASVLRARIAKANGRLDSAIEAMAVAVSLEDDLIYDEPPTWLYPARQAWGAALIEAKRWGDAVTVFKEDLDPKLNPRANPNNGRSLFGLATALKGAGSPWEEVWKQYKAAWTHATKKELEVSDLW